MSSQKQEQLDNFHENFIHKKCVACIRTVHKLNDCLHPMECIPETQFIMRSKIHLAVLLHLRCTVNVIRRRTTPSMNKFYSRLDSQKAPDRILEEAKKLRQSGNISKATPLGRDLTTFGTKDRYSTTVPHRTVVSDCSRDYYSLYFLSTYFSEKKQRSRWDFKTCDLWHLTKWLRKQRSV